MSAGPYYHYGVKIMKECVVACETLRDELNHCMASLGKELSLIWIESGLHNTPEKLKLRLQETLDGIHGYERVLLSFGTCGNSVLGLRIGAYELVMPRVDDCISLLLGSMQERRKIDREYAAYYLTDGWLRGERNLWVEYKYCVDKYGEERARDIAGMMYGHYRTLGLLDPGVNDVAGLVGGTKIIAETLGLEQRVIPAGTGYIRELLTGPWPTDRFIIKEPYSLIENADLSLSESGTDAGRQER